MNILIKKMTVGCPLGKWMMDEAAKGEVPAALFIRKDEKKGVYMVYVDDDSDATKICGKVDSVDGSKDLSVLDSIAGTQYTMKAMGLEGTLIKTVLTPAAGRKVKKQESSGDLDKAFKKAISEGVITEEDRILIESIFDDHRIDPALRLRVVRGYRKYNKPVKKPSSVYVNPEPDEKFSIFSQCLRQAAGRKSAIYKGDKSVGKNVCAETLAYVMQMPYYLVSFNRQMLAEDLYGSRTVKNDAAEMISEKDAGSYVDYMRTGNTESYNGAARFEYSKAKASVMNIALESSEFCEWLENGGVMMFNEINMAEANFLSSFANQLSDGTGFLFVPGRGRIDINPDCVLTGSENENYSGTAEQNEATLSRFAGIEFPYPPSIFNQLKSVTESKRGTGVLSDRFYAQCDKLYKLWRDAVHNGQLSNACLNIRGFARALDEVAISDGYDTLANEINIQIITMCDSAERVSLRARVAEAITV